MPQFRGKACAVINSVPEMPCRAVFVMACFDFKPMCHVPKMTEQGLGQFHGIRPWLYFSRSNETALTEHRAPGLPPRRANVPSPASIHANQLPIGKPVHSPS